MDIQQWIVLWGSKVAIIIIIINARENPVSKKEKHLTKIFFESVSTISELLFFFCKWHFEKKIKSASQRTDNGNQILALIQYSFFCRVYHEILVKSENWYYIINYCVWVSRHHEKGWF